MVAEGGRVLPTDDDRRLDAHAGEGATPEAVVLISERDQLLWQAFARLPLRCQRLLRLLTVVAPPYEEVALALDMPIGSIGPTRRRCLEQLRRSLAASGISADIVDS